MLQLARDRQGEFRLHPEKRRQFLFLRRQRCEPRAFHRAGIFRRAAAQQPTSAVAGGVAAPAPPSAAQRLDELQKLHASGALSDAEYTAARQKIIADL